MVVRVFVEVNRLRLARAVLDADDVEVKVHHVAIWLGGVVHAAHFTVVVRRSEDGIHVGSRTKRSADDRPGSERVRKYGDVSFVGGCRAKICNCLVLHRNPMGNDEENAPAVRVFAFPFEHIVEDVSSDCRGAGADSHRCVGRMCDTKWFGYKWQVAGVSWVAGMILSRWSAPMSTALTFFLGVRTGAARHHLGGSFGSLVAGRRLIAPRLFCGSFGSPLSLIGQAPVEKFE